MAATGLFLFFLFTGIAFYLRPGAARILPRSGAEAPHTLPLSRGGVLALFFIKLTFALAYGYILGHFAPGQGDSWGYFVTSRELAAAIHSPSDFFFWCFPSVSHPSELLHYAFWNSLKGNCFEIGLTAMNLVTAHNYYTDTLLLCMLTFGGWLQFLRLLYALFPGHARWTYVLPFLFPSFLFFYSGLHPDSILFALLGFISFDLYLIIAGKRIMPLVWIRLIACCCLLASFKIFLLLLLLPVLAGWWLARRTPGAAPLTTKRLILAAWAVILGGTLLIFAATLPEIASRQQLYFSAHAVNALVSKPLAPTLSSFAVHLPGALWNGFGPLASWASVPLLYRLAGCEVLVLWALVIYGWIKRTRWRWSFYEAGWIYFAAVNWLLIGYTITAWGAIIRYRDLFLPFLGAFLFFPLIRGLFPARKGITKK